MWFWPNARFNCGDWRSCRAVLRPYRWLGIPAVGLLAFCIAAVVTWWCQFAPRVHDEFSYLLAADTLLHGRLANPTPEFWQPFQSFHIILEPTYASKYPLGPGLSIALGQLLFGTAIAGSWLAAGGCAMALAWALRGVTNYRWATIGGLFVALHPTMQVVWSQSLMNGWLTAAASGLLLGGVLRLRRRVSCMASLAVGFGVAGLALTRPYEGLVATCISGAILWGSWNRHGLHRKIYSGLVVSGMASVPVAVALVLMAAQNMAVSGSYRRMPYQIHESVYGVAPLFVFGAPKAPLMEATGELPNTIHTYHHGWSLDSYQRRAGWWGWGLGIYESCQTLWNFGLCLTIIPLLTVMGWGRFRVARFLALAFLAQIVCSSLVCWIFSHYLSPVLPWLLVLTIVGLRSCQRWLAQVSISSQQCAGVALAMQLAILLIGTGYLRSSSTRGWALQRAAIDSKLQTLPGKHLVIVRYGEDHNVNQEWVYNGADLTNGKVLWARGERDARSRRLQTETGAARYVWQLHVDGAGRPPTLISKPAATHALQAAR